MKSPDNSINIITLPSGLRLLHCHNQSEVEYFGVAADAGSRDDPQHLHGLAHFVEHVIFKGTSRRRSWHIINRMEAVGGELNAYTTKESTVVYTIYPQGNFSRACDLLGDLLCHSVFPAKELERERQVVADEINQYRDIPSEAVFDDFEDKLFAGSGLGHNILGTIEALQRFTPEICSHHLRESFTADSCVAFYSGTLPLAKVARGVERHFSELQPRRTITFPQRTIPAPTPVFDLAEMLDNHQDNTIMGTRGHSLHSPERWPLALLSNIIGGPGLNSLLNVEMRERRGLVYAVESSSTTFTDSGMLTIYFGCDHHDANRCRRIVTRTLEEIASYGVTPRFLKAAKKQYLGQLTLASDNRDSAIMAMARSVLYRGKINSRTDVTDRVNSITMPQLKQQAEQILSQGISILSLR